MLQPSVVNIKSPPAQSTQSDFLSRIQSAAPDLMEKTAEDRGLSNLLLLAECTAVFARSTSVEEVVNKLYRVLSTKEDGSNHEGEQAQYSPSDSSFFSGANDDLSSCPSSDLCASTAATLESLPIEHKSAAVISNTNLLSSTVEDLNHSLPPSYCYCCGGTLSLGVQHYCSTSELMKSNDASSTLSVKHAHPYSESGPILFESGHDGLHSRTAVGISTFTPCDNTTGKAQDNLVPSNTRRYSVRPIRKLSNNRHTTFHLNKLYYETFGNDRKLTRTDRRKVEEKTGVEWKNLSRGIYYRKCHYQAGLKVYKKLAHSGKITGYKSFLEYCETHDVPEAAGYRYGVLPVSHGWDDSSR